MDLRHLANLPASKPLEEMTREELIDYCKGKDALNMALVGAVEIANRDLEVYKEKYEKLKKLLTKISRYIELRSNKLNTWKIN
jgi:hypothetical protein